MEQVYTPIGQPDVQVGREPWGWEAHYEDGSVLKQFADDGVFHRIREVTYPGLVEFRMVSGDRVYKIPYQPGTELVHFYRNTVFNVGTVREERVRLYCFGYKMGSTSYVQAIHPDGSVAPVT